MKIDTSYCETQPPESLIKEALERYVDVEGTYYVFENNFNEQISGDNLNITYALLPFKVGDRVRNRYQEQNMTTTGIIYDITPANYGTFNIHVKYDDEVSAIMLPGDLVLLNNETKS